MISTSNNRVSSITKSCTKRIIDYCAQQLPYEACGLLLAATDSDTIIDFQPIVNRHEAAEQAFLFDAEQWVHHYFSAIQSGHHVVGIFHSHPAEEASPSQADIEGFIDHQLIYAIVSLKQIDRPQLQFYRFDHAANRFWDCPLMLA
ncbi:M67 family metallopeptidase [Paenibacillus camelliae]|uniref:M67 family metallopeptidase n=1 Tax=Paenibacillus camelliae TaxID=512410 RepID=UPI0032E801E2